MEVYEWPPMAAFLAEVTGKEHLLTMEDPLEFYGRIAVRPRASGLTIERDQDDAGP